VKKRELASSIQPNGEKRLSEGTQSNILFTGGIDLSTVAKSMALKARVASCTALISGDFE
jgi:hypothetical protein